MSFNCVEHVVIHVSDIFKCIVELLVAPRLEGKGTRLFFWNLLLLGRLGGERLNILGSYIRLLGIDDDVRLSLRLWGVAIVRRVLTIVLLGCRIVLIVLIGKLHNYINNGSICDFVMLFWLVPLPICLRRIRRSR